MVGNPRRRVSLRVAYCALLVSTLAYACGGDSTGPGGTGIRVIAGAEQADTALALLKQALVVEIRDKQGRIAPGKTVRFALVGDGTTPYVAVGRVDSNRVDFEVNVVTDSRGRAVVVVRLGSVAGTARLAISVAELALADTVTYTVKPGGAAKFMLSPRDTTVGLTTSYALNAVVTDLWGNQIAGAQPTFSPTGVTVSPTGQVTTPSAPVRAQIVVSYQGVADTARVSAVPLLSMVIDRDGDVALVNSDGTGFKTLATSSDISLSPSSVPTTPNVVYYIGSPGMTARVWVVQPNGTPRPLVSAETRSESWPRLSPDGAWVYFMRDWGTLWRVRLDGTGLDSLTTYSPSQSFAWPTVSPDGKSVAVQSGNGLKIVDVATKASRTVSVACDYPSYSPDGAWFACASASDISIMKTDGTSRRVVVSFPANNGPSYLSGLDWTPDGNWLLAMTGGATS